ncbi:hypothetical protein VFPPC_17687 [Pochonia chlamydosporia 170]|uniref:Uncharacterized protein n=1 Tax=Pochonia chlamydosporia 170 TaxID=1380566 RepID=A0A219AQU0_METCM|nr:hypothetical protein VFPPC_17687 [Pochonia chlamydosporia 170]OWT43137.1 hypothetical protein VFPPC_17687 [Pochonia chlamydosporia 170]
MHRVTQIAGVCSAGNAAGLRLSIELLLPSIASLPSLAPAQPSPVLLQALGPLDTAQLAFHETMPFYSNPFFISVMTNLTKALHLKVSLPFCTISSPYPLPCLAGVVRPVGLGMESTLSTTRLLLEGHGSRCTVKMPGPDVWV